MTNTERCVVIGDVHGCLEQLDELLKVIQYRPGKDRLIFLGDLIDKGPDPVGVVRRVRELGAECILGNHEEKALRWRKRELERAITGKENKIKARDEGPRWADLSDEDDAWLRSLPLFLRPKPGWILVHGGLTPNSPVEEQGDSVLRLRWLKPDESQYGGDPFNPPPTCTRWATSWRGQENVVYGHAVYDLKHPTIDAARSWPRGILRPHCYGIDTGCVYGGHLTAMDLDTKDFYQVHNPVEYCEWAGKGPYK